MIEKIYTVGLVLLNDYGLFYSVDAQLIYVFDEVEETETFRFVIAPQPKPYIIVHVTDNIISPDGKYCKETFIQNLFYPYLNRMLNPMELGLKGQFAAIDVERIDMQFFRQSDLAVNLDSTHYPNEIF